MESNRHTPGPWHREANRENVVHAISIFAVVDGPEGPEPWDLGSATTEADARLMQAAPDLLASLEEMVAELLAHAALGLNEAEVAMLKRAEAAIAAASPPAPPREPVALSAGDLGGLAAAPGIDLAAAARRDEPEVMEDEP